MPVTVQIAKLLQGTELRFVSDEAAAESRDDCTGCSAPCCRAAALSAVPLSLAEAEKLPHTLGAVRLPGGTVELTNVALLARHPVTGECVFVQPNGRCSIWNIRPKACRVYSCKGTRCVS